MTTAEEEAASVSSPSGRNWTPLAGPLLLCGFVFAGIVVLIGLAALLLPFSSSSVGVEEKAEVSFRNVEAPGSRASTTDLMSSDDVAIAGWNESPTFDTQSGTYSPQGDTKRGTWAIPLDEDARRQRVKLTDEMPYVLSPDGRYLVTSSGDSFNVIRLNDRMIVARIRGRIIFTGPDQLLVFGQRPNYQPGGVLRVDIEDQTVDELDVPNLTSSVDPLWTRGGKVALCTEKEGDSGGADCFGTILLDPSTGGTEPYTVPPSSHPVMVDSCVGRCTNQYWLGAEVWVAAPIDNGIIAYWADERLGDRRQPLRVGAPSGPTPADAVGKTIFESLDAIIPTSDRAGAVVHQNPVGGGPGVYYCKFILERCRDLGLGAADWRPVAIVPSAALEGS